MKIKKVFGLIICLLLTSIILIGCSNSNEANGSGQSTESEETQVTLHIWGDSDNQQTQEPAFTKINEAFMEKYPNIELDYEYSGTLESINVALQSNTLPDLFWVQGNKSTQMAEMARNDYLLPLDEDELDLSRFPEESIEYATVDGNFYSSFPSFISYVTVFYNEDIFEEHNLEVPVTWYEFEEIAKTLGDNDVTPVAVGGNGDFDRYWILQAMAASLASDVMNDILDGEEDIDYTNLEKTFEAYKDFSVNGYFGKDVIAIDGDGATLAFSNGNAAMIADGTWQNDIYQDTSMNVGRFALPGFEGESYAQTGPSNANTYAVSKATEHPDEALKYIQFLNSKEAQQIVADEMGEVPMLDDITPRDGAIEEMADFDNVGLNIYNILAQVADSSSNPDDLLLTDIAPKLMTEQINGQEAVELLKDELDKRTEAE